ncbi:hypothetical protein HZA33_02685 [Candidatus Pacearchaeota archaeon]|nr:hypothetical protein [Candidatus Pacearchaeota archaeon]
MSESFITILLTVIVVVISLIIPLPIAEQYRILIIAAAILFIIGVSLSGFEKKLKDQEEENKKIEEKLKIHELLINIKSDIKELQRKVFK